jgi:hypothetical protein
VRHIFARYLQLGSVLALHGELEASGIFGRARTIRGKTRAPKPMSRGALYLLLSNRIYLGEICHKGSSYPGEHEQLIDAKLFRGGTAPSGEQPQQPERRCRCRPAQSACRNSVGCTWPAHVAQPCGQLACEPVSLLCLPARGRRKRPARVACACG